MRIRMITLACGPNGNWNPGQVVEVPDAEGQQLVKGGYAVALNPPKPATPAVAAAGQRTVERTVSTRRPERRSAQKPVQKPDQKPDQPQPDPAPAK